MRDMQHIQQLASEMLAAARAADPHGEATLLPDDGDLAVTTTGDRVDTPSDASLEALSAVGRWIWERTDASGRLRPTAPECRKLIATEAGRQLAAALAEWLDLSALYLDPDLPGATLEDARRSLRLQALRGGGGEVVAPVAHVRLAMAASTVAVPVRSEEGAVIVGIDAIIAAQFIDARVLPYGTSILLAAVGHIRPMEAGHEDSPALLLVSPDGLVDVRVDGLGLDAEQARGKAALVEPQKYPGWPEISRAAELLRDSAQGGDVDRLALRALTALNRQRFADARAAIDAIGSGESRVLDELAGLLREYARTLEVHADD